MQKIHQVFNNKALRSFLLSLRIPIVLILLAAWPWWVKKEWLCLAIVISFVGVLIQCWCFACLEKEKVLTIRGPYQLCRNPMYLGRYFLMAGFIIATGHWIALAIFTVIYYFYMVNRVKREEPVLEGIFGDPYREYCRDVRPFLPGLKRVDKQFWFFNSKILFSNNGHWNFLSVIVGYVYIIAMMKWVVGSF